MLTPEDREALDRIARRHSFGHQLDVFLRGVWRLIDVAIGLVLLVALVVFAANHGWAGWAGDHAQQLVYLACGTVLGTAWYRTRRAS